MNLSLQRLFVSNQHLDKLLIFQSNHLSEIVLYFPWGRGLFGNDLGH